MYKSQKQKEWANTEKGKKALGEQKVNHLNKLSEGKFLLNKVILHKKQAAKKSTFYKSHFTRVSWKGLK